MASTAKACLHYSASLDYGPLVQSAYINDDGVQVCSGTKYNNPNDYYGRVHWSMICISGYSLYIDMNLDTELPIWYYGTPHGSYQWSVTYYALNANQLLAAGSQFC
jgi:hypothetical protein